MGMEDARHRTRLHRAVAWTHGRAEVSRRSIEPADRISSVDSKRRAWKIVYHVAHSRGRRSDRIRVPDGAAFGGSVVGGTDCPPSHIRTITSDDLPRDRISSYHTAMSMLPRRPQDRIEPCAHHRRDRLGYLAAFNDAQVRTARGEAQTQCPKCKLWLWPHEIGTPPGAPREDTGQ